MFSSKKREFCGRKKVDQFKHNPYVGNVQYINSKPLGLFPLHQDHELSILLPDQERTKNPHLGIFRHSPSTEGMKRRNRRGNNRLRSGGNKINPLSFLEDRPFTTRSDAKKAIKLRENHVGLEEFHKLPPPTVLPPNLPSSLSLSPSDRPNCSICLDVFRGGDEVRELGCGHVYHRDCIDVWLLGHLSSQTTNTTCCPICYAPAIRGEGEEEEEEERDEVEENEIDQILPPPPILSSTTRTTSSSSDVDPLSFHRIGAFLFNQPLSSCNEEEEEDGKEEEEEEMNESWIQIPPQQQQQPKLRLDTSLVHSNLISSSSSSIHPIMPPVPPFTPTSKSSCYTSDSSDDEMTFSSSSSNNKGWESRSNSGASEEEIMSTTTSSSNINSSLSSGGGGGGGGGGGWFGWGGGKKRKRSIGRRRRCRLQ